MIGNSLIIEIASRNKIKKYEKSSKMTKFEVKYTTGTECSNRWNNGFSLRNASKAKKCT